MKDWLKSVDNWVYQNRALSLLLTIMVTLVAVAVINWASGSDLFRQFFFPKICDNRLPTTCDPLQWKDLFQAAILVLGLPIAFLIWYWRDTNVRDQIEEQRKQVENARKDTNLKEFQELQLRAAGAMAQSQFASAAESIQIASLHQLRVFLKGDYGEAFKLPTFELYCALLAKPTSQENAVGKNIGLTSAVQSALRQIIVLEWKAFFLSGFPLQGRCFDGLHFTSDMNLRSLSFSGSTFRNATLLGPSFAGAGLNQCNFTSAKLDFCNLEKANLYQAIFEHAKMSCSILCGADLREVDPSRMAYLISCEYDAATRFGAIGAEPLSAMGERTEEEARESWLAKGLMLSDGKLDDFWQRSFGSEA
jgi:uncharacterized protein YjbI with pentapeptide repeats